MNFRTQIPITVSPNAMDYQSKIVSLGSCFAVNMGEKFHFYKLECAVNPFGIIFNPVSLEKIIRRCIARQKFTEHDIFFHNDLWHCFEVHSEWSHPDKDTVVHNLNCQLELTLKQLLQATHCIITLGTAWVYREIKSDSIVANCHKVPQKRFTKALLTVGEIQDSLHKMIKGIASVNPNCRFIFTVSPVRHSKDGLIENNLSKAHLITALFNAVGFTSPALPLGTACHSAFDYFPGYEIVMDELRDYRFYAPDMLHPSSVAIDYIWERFSEAYFSIETKKIMAQVAAIQKDLLHRPFNPDSENHGKFLQNLNQKISKLEAQYPSIKF